MSCSKHRCHPGANGSQIHRKIRKRRRNRWGLHGCQPHTDVLVAGAKALETAEAHMEMVGQVGQVELVAMEVAAAVRVKLVERLAEAAVEMAAAAAKGEG